jgi:UDP-N-acetylmuramoyl-L-alanyl-D-glutamate--2,6-diaminopimelate ligase
MVLEELLTLVSSDGGPAVRTDSRQVRAGDVFVAIAGTAFDGHDFIDRAVAQGAKYIVSQRGRSVPETLPSGSLSKVLVEDSAGAAGLLAQAQRGNPAARLINLTVTGTNGKTTVAFLVHACIQHAGPRCGLLGTVVYDTGSGITASSLTTPDPLTIAEMQAQMVDAGAKYMIAEASSHALSQDRLAGIAFHAAAFTNLTGDHLDYHQTKENYLAAKTRLFTALRPNATAVLNKQAPESQRIAEQTKARICWYAIGEPADLTAHVESMTVDGTRFVLDHQGHRAEVGTPLVGQYNVANHLAAAGLCLAAGFDLGTVATGLSALRSIPGRLEKVDGADFPVVVDYAHTDDALKNVLETLKPLCKNKLIALFGCGGDRDRTKRPRMARVAEQIADAVVVTSDNPRTEDPKAIIDDIIGGFANPDSDAITIEPDRAKAIEQAIGQARAGDVVLIAGKGHETYQIIGQERLHFSDQEVAQQCLKERGC